MALHLKHDVLGEGLSLGAQAEDKARRMAERRARLRARKEEAAKKAFEEREAFSAQMAQEAMEVISSSDSAMLKLEFRSSSPRLSELIEVVFIALDGNGDNKLSFPEVLSCLGEFKKTREEVERLEVEGAGLQTSEDDDLFGDGIFDGPTSRWLGSQVKEKGLDLNEVLKLVWNLETWRAYWQSTRMTEPDAISRLAGVRRRLESQGTWDEEKIAARLLEWQQATETSVTEHTDPSVDEDMDQDQDE